MRSHDVPLYTFALAWTSMGFDLAHSIWTGSSRAVVRVRVSETRMANPTSTGGLANMLSAAFPEIKLTSGRVINDRWRVMEKLGEGGFGAVYKVQEINIKREYAMKVESKREEDSKLRIETIVLRLLTQRDMLRHSCAFIDEGDTSVLRFVVMQLIGRSLSELRRATKTHCFSANTTIRLGAQALEAIETLHRIGFLHRDIKPDNFAMGRQEADKRNVYMLDCGMSRQYVTPDGQLRPPRKVASFRGTVRYASINTHQRKEQGRHDDLWSLLYMMIELRTGKLPWRKIADKDLVQRKKQDTPVEELLQCLNEPEFFRMYETVSNLGYNDAPNYEIYHIHFRTVAARNRYLDVDPFDWEPGGGTSLDKPAAEKQKRNRKGKKKGQAPRDDDMDGLDG